MYNRSVCMECTSLIKDNIFLYFYQTEMVSFMVSVQRNKEGNIVLAKIKAAVGYSRPLSLFILQSPSFSTPPAKPNPISAMEHCKPPLLLSWVYFLIVSFCTDVF